MAQAGAPADAPLRIVILGGGAVGGYLAARLAQLGARVRVTLVARGAHLAAVQSDGLRLVSSKPAPGALPPPDGQPTTIRVPAGALVATDLLQQDERHAAADWVLVTVKLFDTKAAIALAQRAGLIGAATSVASFQNGVDAVALVRDALAAAGAAGAAGERLVLAGATYTPVTVTAPGEVTHMGAVDRFTFGPASAADAERYAAAQALAPAERLLALLQAAGVTAELSPCLAVALWTKLSAKAAFDAVSVLGRLDLGTALAHPASAALFERAAREVADVARAIGVGVALDSVETLLAFAREEQSPRARSSMLTDLEAGKPLEVEFLSGAVARHGKAAGVPTPVHDVVSAVLAPHAGKV